MKKIGFTIGMVLIVISASGFEQAQVDFKMNARRIKSADRKWCYVKKSDYPDAKIGHNGLLVLWSSFHEDFRAFDRKCPVCDKNGVNSSIHMYNRFEAICDKCRTRYEVINSAGFPANSNHTDCPLVWYNCYVDGEILHIYSNDLYRDKNINSYYPVPRRRK
jgi:hypothetical protein